MNKSTVTIGVVCVGVGVTLIAVGMRPADNGGGSGSGDPTIEPTPHGGEEVIVDAGEGVVDDSPVTGDNVPDDVAGVLGMAEGAHFG